RWRPVPHPSGLVGIGASVAVIVRAPATREVSWRVSVREAGDRRVALQVYDKPYDFELTTRSANRAIGHERRARSIMGGLTEIGLPRIGNDSPLEAVSIAYPSASYSLFGARMSWLLVFALGTFVGASIPAMLLR